jgi:phage shock protein A
MSIFARYSAIFKTRANQLADRFEDPKASLDYSLTKLEESRAQISRGLIEVSAARNRLVFQRDQLSTAIEKSQDQAQLAVRAGRDDLARTALERRQEAESRYAGIEGIIANLDRQAETLKQSQASLDHKIAYFRSKKEELKAIYDSSRAQLQMREAVSGISADLTDAGNTIRRAEDRIREMQSRADAIEGLVVEGVLIDVLEPEVDDIDRQLLLVDHQRSIDSELARLKSGSA